jgi:hypothetical protein
VDGDGLQICRLTANLLNKQSWTDDKATRDGLPSLGIMKCHEGLCNWTDSSDNQHKLRKMDLIFGTFFVKSSHIVTFINLLRHLLMERLHKQEFHLTATTKTEMSPPYIPDFPY